MRARRRHPLVALLWLLVLAAIFYAGSPLLANIGQQLGSLYAARIAPGSAPIATEPAPLMEPTAQETPAHQGHCDALSAETLTTYVKVPVSASHEPDGHCAWVTDPSDPSSAVVRVRWVEAYAVAHLTGPAALVTESYDPAARSRTSVLMARPGQWIPVADTRTEAQWPMYVTIMRDPLNITHERADQILRAVAADLNREAAP